jgi:hypothetical protein
MKMLMDMMKVKYEEENLKKMKYESIQNSFGYLRNMRSENGAFW